MLKCAASTTLGIDCLTIQNGNLASLNNDELNTPKTPSVSNISTADQKNSNANENSIIDLNVEECILSSSTDIDTCAEIVGLTLISKFSKAHLPNLSELAWVMSDDVKPTPLKSERIQSNIVNIPKNLNTDIKSHSHSTSQEINKCPTTGTRGTLYWAPPRRQIIFTLHPNPM